MPEAVIVATGRTPIGRSDKGSLVDVRPDDLAAGVVHAVIESVPELDPLEIEDLIVGCGMPAGESGFNLARVTAIVAGLDTVPGVTVNRYCSSSLQAIRMAFHAIRSGEGEVFVAAGVETVSRFKFGTSDILDAVNPLFESSMVRTQERSLGTEGTWAPPQGLPDVYIAMGQTAENVAELESVSREEMDEFALRSHELAVTNQNSGYFDREIVPVRLRDASLMTRDDGPRPDTTIERLSSLRPAFRPGGRVTAGNSCPLNDGAAAVVVMSDVKARQLGIRPLARIVSSAVTALDPEIMGLGPVEASRLALARAKLSMDDVDLVEINEAFAAQVIPSARRLGIPWDKLNVRGGSIALGHPFGMTGARIMTSLIHALRESGQRYGLETMCVGGGQGMAMVIESLDA